MPEEGTKLKSPQMMSRIFVLSEYLGGGYRRFEAALPEAGAEIGEEAAVVRSAALVRSLGTVIAAVTAVDVVEVPEL